MHTSRNKSNSLSGLLENASWRALRGIASHARFTFHHHQGRDEAASELAKHLAKEAVIKRVLSATTESARELLIAVLAGEATIAVSLLELIGGKVRPLTYQRVADAPWRDPQNDAEELVYRGLLLADAQKESYCIADELIPTLQAELLPVSALSGKLLAAETGALTPTSALRHDLLVLLLYVQRHSPKVLTKQRLPITAVRALNPLLAKKQDISAIRTHTQVPHLWFLCKLARQAHLIEAEVGDRFWLTATAHSWLAAEEAEQLSHLYHALPLPIDWPPFSWPKEWHELWMPVEALFATWRTKLTRLPVGQWVERAAWEAAEPPVLALTDWGVILNAERSEDTSPAAGGAESLAAETAQSEALRLFCDAYLRPFVALGIVELDESRQNIRLTELGATLLPLFKKEATPAQIKETAQQIAALHTSQDTAPSLHPEATFAAWQREGQQLIIPWPASFPAIWQLSPFATLTKGGTSIEFELTWSTVASALSRGFPLSDLRHALEAGGLPLTKDLLPEHPAPRIRAGYWLETNSPMQLEQLRTERGVRLGLRNGKKFTPRHHTIDPRYLNSLQKALQDLGQPAIMEIPTNDPLFDQKTLRNLLENPRRHRAPTTGLLLLAVRLWQREITRLDKTYPQVARTRPYIPQTLIQALDATLNPVERAAVEQIWQDTLKQLDPTIWDPPAVVAEPDDGLRHLAPLQQAIDRAQPVRIEYEPAGKPASQRVIDPHYLEKSRDLWYLHAYCRQAQDNRQFRLDRIRQLTSLPKNYIKRV